MSSFNKLVDALLVSLKNELILAMNMPGKLQPHLPAGVSVLAMLKGEGAEIVDGSGAGLSCLADDVLALAPAVGPMADMRIEGLLKMDRSGPAISEHELDRGALISRPLSCFDELSAVGKTVRGSR